MPGMLSISVLFAGLFCPGGFLLRDLGLRRFVPGIFIPGMLLLSCFLPSCFFRATFFFAFDFGFGFDLLIPGILDISCCARTGKSATSNKKLAKTSAQTFILKRKLFALTFFIIPLRKLFRTNEVFRQKYLFIENNRFGCLVKNERTRFSYKI